MKTYYAVICLIGLVFIFRLCDALNPPTTNVWNVPYTGMTVVPLERELGQESFNTKSYTSNTTATFQTNSPYGIQVIYPFNYSSIYSIGGLVVSDPSNSRVAFYSGIYSATNLPIPTAVYGQPNFTANQLNILDSNYDITFDLTSLYVVSKKVIYVWDMIPFIIQNTTIAESPTSYFGNISYPGYTPIGLTQSIQFDYFGNRSIFVTDQLCQRVIEWGRSPRNYSSPVGVLGQPDLAACKACDANTPGVTCFTPDVLVIDCYGGLWIHDAVTKAILYFPKGSKTATYVLKAPNLPDHSTDFDSVTGLAFSRNCTYLAIASYTFLYIVQIPLIGGVPQQPVGSLVLGVGLGVVNGPATNMSDSCFLLNSVVWDYYNPGNLWASDAGNKRVVYLSPFSPQARFIPYNGTQTPSPSSSLVASSSRSPNSSASNRYSWLRILSVFGI